MSPGPLIKTIVMGSRRVVKRKCRRQCKRLRTRQGTLTRYAGSPRKTAVCIALRPYYRRKGRPPYASTLLTTKVHEIIVKSGSPGPLMRKGNVQVLQRRNIRIARRMLRGRYSTRGRIFFRCVRAGLPFIVLGCTVALSKGVTACAKTSH